MFRQLINRGDAVETFNDLFDGIDGNHCILVLLVAALNLVAIFAGFGRIADNAKRVSSQKSLNSLRYCHDIAPLTNSLLTIVTQTGGSG
jgi:hypothetical protein